jgi:hypothetical protein
MRVGSLLPDHDMLGGATVQLGGHVVPPGAIDLVVVRPPPTHPEVSAPCVAEPNSEARTFGDVASSKYATAACSPPPGTTRI